MKREIRNPIWKSELKDSVMCEIAIIDDNGDEAVHRGEISKQGEGGSTNPDWDLVLKNYSIEVIDQYTEDFHIAQQEEAGRQREVKEEQKRRQEERKKQEDLFASKLEIFEIPEVKSSNDRTAKSKIRKAKSIPEAIIYATKIIMENESSGSTGEE